MRHRGLCQGVDDQDPVGSAALNSSHAPIRVYDAGDIIYDQGDPEEHVFILVSGWVALHRELPDGRHHIIQFLQPGAMFAVEPAGQPLSHGATALTNASICPINRSRLGELRQRLPSLNERFIQLLERDIRHLFELQTTLGQGRAKERVGALLYELANIASGSTPLVTGSRIKLPLTQRLIADAVGLTSIHINRVLRQLRDADVAEFLFGTLTVLNAGKLRALAECRIERHAWDDRSRPDRVVTAVQQVDPAGSRRGRDAPSAGTNPGRVSMGSEAAV